MKTVAEQNNSNMPVVVINSSLNKYKDKTLFLKKLALANEQLKGVRLPPKKQHS